MRYLTPIPKQFVDQSGIPYSDGTVSVYLSGSDELADIFEAAEGDALCPNPCKLDSNGAWQCFVPGDVPLDYIVQDKHGNVVFPYYNILPGSGSGSGAVFTVKGTEGEIKVTNRVTTSGRREATVGIDPAFKQRIDHVEDDIGDLNEEMRGVEGSIQELNEDVDHLDDRVEEAEGQIDQLSESLAEKKDRQTPVVIGNIPANKTVKRISQNANGEIDVDTQDIEFPDYSQRFDNIENEQIVDAKVIAAALNDLNVRMESVEDSQCDKNIGERIADAFDSQNLFERGVRVKVRQAAKSLDGATNKTVTNVSQDENGEITVTFSSISLSDYEKTANKKTSVTGNEGSNTYYPTIKALVDYLDSRLQNLGGKKITNNGVPFTTASQLPTTTPYYGQNINSDDYAYVQDTGLASRYTATVTGSSVAWSLDYEIALPVFTTEQQAAINSGANSTKIGNYDSHLENTDNPHGVTYSQVGASPDTHTHQVVINGVTKTIDKTGGTPVDLGTYLTSHQDLSNYLTKMGNGSDVTASFTAADSRNNISTGEKLSVIFGKIAKWFSDLKAVAFSGSYNDLSEAPALGSLASKNNISDSDINGTISDEHIASSSTWNAKQNAIADLSDIRDGASKGETAVQPEDLVTYMTNPVEGGVIAAALNDLNARLNALEYESDNIGDKIADKFDAQVLRCGGVDVKTKQAAKGNPSASSGSANTFVDTITQNENGEMTATRRVMKMYSGTGTNTDAPMTQKAASDAIALKANIASPTFTGTPAAPTASGPTDTTQIATTAFVHDAIENDLKKAADVSGIGNDDTHAYSGEAVSMAISSAVSGNVGGFLGNMTVAQMNAYTTPKMGDNAIMTDTGTITVGSESCVITTAPSEVRWTTSGSWKVSSAGYVRDTQVATTSVLGLVKLNTSNGGVSLNSSNQMIVNGWSEATAPGADSLELIFGGTASTSFTNAVEAFNAGKKIYCLWGGTVSGLHYAKKIPLSCVLYDGNNNISRFYFNETLDAIAASTDVGAVHTMYLSSTAWYGDSSAAYKMPYYAETAGTADKANNDGGGANIRNSYISDTVESNTILPSTPSTIKSLDSVEVTADSNGFRKTTFNTSTVPIPCVWLQTRSTNLNNILVCRDKTNSSQTTDNCAFLINNPDRPLGYNGFTCLGHEKPVSYVQNYYGVCSSRYEGLIEIDFDFKATFTGSSDPSLFNGWLMQIQFAAAWDHNTYMYGFPFDHPGVFCSATQSYVQGSGVSPWADYPVMGHVRLVGVMVNSGARRIFIGAFQPRSDYYIKMQLSNIRVKSTGNVIEVQPPSV